MSVGEIVILGGGVAGLCSAYYLQKQNWKVTLVDEGDFTNNCSFGNAGLLVPSHFVPLAAPGVVSQGLKWMFDKKSPFSIRFGFKRDLFKWGVQFKNHCTKNHVKRSAPFLRDLNLFSKREYLFLKDQNTFDFSFATKGVLMLYRTDKIKNEEIKMAQIAKDLGLDCEVLDREHILTLEPNLTDEVLGGVHYKSDGHIIPGEFMNNLRQHLKKLGVTFIPNQEIVEINKTSKKVKSLSSKSKTFSADKFILAPGANMSKIGRMLNLNIPTIQGKGYSFMTTHFEKYPSYPALLQDDKISITLMGNQVRVGGTMELGAEHHQINPHKIEGLKRAVPRYYKNVDLNGIKQNKIWHGFRPCAPDGLPYLGSLSSFDNTIIAGGGCMMGMSLGPGFGRVVAELAIEKKPSLNIDIFDPERFN